MRVWVAACLFLLLWAAALKESDAVCCPVFAEPPFGYAMCPDGKLADGYYCGRGPCNMFGCNCDGGCIPDGIDVIAGQPESLLFRCAASAIVRSLDLETLLANPDCSCMADYRTWGKGAGYVVRVENVTGPEQDISNPMICDEGVESCSLSGTHVQSFTVTTSLSAGVAIPLPGEVEMSLGAEVSWSKTTGTETTYTCTVTGGSEARLTVRPEYIKATTAKIYEWRDGRPRCELTSYFIPRIFPDGSIKGYRRCSVKKLHDGVGMQVFVELI